jgi:hypothetical protein
LLRRVKPPFVPTVVSLYVWNCVTQRITKTNSMEQSSPWEGNSFSSSQILSLVCNVKLHYLSTWACH